MLRKKFQANAISAVFNPHTYMNICVWVVFLFIGSIFADKIYDGKAPANPGSALIIYNSQISDDPSQRKWDHSPIAMRVFRAALDPSQEGGISFPNGQPFSGGIPEIEDARRLKNVMALDVKHLGIDKDLRELGNSLPEREKKIFDELYEAKNPLSYWGQVYDLRYIQVFWQEGSYKIYDTMATITTVGDRSDLAYYKALLRDGGGLYIQSADGYYETRNNSLRDVVRALTVDKSFAGVAKGVHILVGTAPGFPTSSPCNPTARQFWFNDSDLAEKFATDWNPLPSLQQQYPMKWIRAGGVKLSASDKAIPLVNAGSSQTDTSIMIFWDRNGLDSNSQQENYKNGRLIVGFGIDAWTDNGGPGDPCNTTGFQYGHGNGSVTRTTMALIQNLYDLMSGTQRYSISKQFLEEERDVGQTGTLRIAVRNPNNYTISLSDGIKDILVSCLKFVPGSSKFSIVEDGAVVQTITDATAQPTINGQELNWKLGSAIPARSDWVIEFQYEVTGFPPCN